MPHDHLTDIGLAVLRTGWLKQLRNALRISRRQLADIMGVSIQTAKRWEEGVNKNAWAASVRRVGQFYVDAMEELEKVYALGAEFEDYIPASVMASYLAHPTFIVEKMCEEGELHCLNLGVLGVYVRHRIASDGSR